MLDRVAFSLTSIAGVLMSAAAALAGPPPLPAEEHPPGALPGQCFAKVLRPEVTETYTEQELVAPQGTVTRVVPGECRFEDRTVVVREPSTELITFPPTYKPVTETVVTRPAGVRTETIPPVYGTITEQIKVREGYTIWRPGAALGFSPAAPVPAYGAPTRVLPTGEVLCLVQVPPEYRTVTRQVLKVPGRILQVPYPAETALVTRQVLDVPAHVEKRIIPGETRVVRAKVCAPDRTVSTIVPPEYRTVTKTRTISPAQFEWKIIDCHAEIAHDQPPPAAYVPPPPPPPRHRPFGTYYAAPPADDRSAGAVPPRPPHGAFPPPSAGAAASGDRAVARLQAALAARGYYAGPQDGLFTPPTLQAMRRYQRDHHLAEGRYTGETANALGISR